MEDSWEGLDMLHCSEIGRLNSLPRVAPNFSKNSILARRAFKKLNFIKVSSLPSNIELGIIASWSTCIVFLKGKSLAYANLFVPSLYVDTLQFLAKSGFLFEICDFNLKTG